MKPRITTVFPVLFVLLVVAKECRENEPMPEPLKAVEEERYHESDKSQERQREDASEDGWNPVG